MSGHNHVVTIKHIAVEERSQKAIMKTKTEQFPAKNPNPVLSVAVDGTVLFSNDAAEPLLIEWGMEIGEKLPSYIGDIMQRVLCHNSPEKLEVKAGNKVYMVSFHPLLEEKCINIYGFDISDHNEVKEKVQKSETRKIAKLELAEMVDSQAIQSLMDDFYKLAHIPMSLDDLKGNVLVGVGWQDICTKFHRVHSETCKHCVESDTKLSAGVPLGEFKIYKCKNNMWDIATPIMVGGQHVGNIFSGQFFFDDEPLDYEFFRSQAKKYGFNEEEYISALEKVPRLSREAVNIGMSFFMKLANMLSQLSHSNIKLVQSLSERDTLLEALRMNEEKYRNIVETANEGIHVIDAEHRNTYVNEKMAEMLGYSRKDLIGKSVRDFTDDEGKAVFEMNMKKRRQGINESHEFRYIRKDGLPLWTQVNSKSLFDKDGKFAGSISMLTDITERKEAEAKLKDTLDNLENSVKERTEELEKAYKSLIESEQGLAEAQKMAHIGNWDWDLVTNKMYWSDEMYRIFRLTPLESGSSYDVILSRTHPDDREYVDNAVKRAYNGEPFNIDHRIVLADGTERVVHAQGEVIFVEKNSPIRMRGTVQDITERKKTEEKIQALLNAVESSNDAIITESLECIITSWNKGAEQVFGYSAEEILGKNISILEPSDLKGEIKQFSEKIKNGKKIQRYETSRLKKDFTIISVSVTLSPIFDSSGKLIAILAISRDVTERIKSEKALLKAEETRKKEIHHRIKNNLQVISSLLDLQAEKFNDTKVIEAFRESQSRVVSMALIHEELYKGEGTDTLNFSEYLKTLTENLFQTYSLSSKNIRLCMYLEENAFFNMDTAIPLGILINELVSNSLKHAFPGKDKGEIQIKLHREENGEYEKEGCKSTNFTLIVSDNGVGIPENLGIEDLNSLGLQLVTSLVDQLDGEFELKRNNGTEFTMKFTVTEQ